MSLDNGTLTKRPLLANIDENSLEMGLVGSEKTTWKVCFNKYIDDSYF